MFWLEPYTYPIAGYLILCRGTLFNTAVNFGDLRDLVTTSVSI